MHSHAAKRTLAAKGEGCGALLADQLGLDEHRIILSHLTGAGDLAAFACASSATRLLAGEERLRRQRLQIYADVAARREKRLARARLYGEAEGDARLIATVIRHVLRNAPKEYASAAHLAAQGGLDASDAPLGVCRLRVGVHGGSVKGVIAPDASSAQRFVDVLAMQESALRQVIFCGEPLGPKGAGVAMRQALRLGLCGEAKTAYQNHIFRVFLRADVVVQVLGSSPSLQRLVAATDDQVQEE